MRIEGPPIRVADQNGPIQSKQPSKEAPAKALIKTAVQDPLAEIRKTAQKLNDTNDLITKLEMRRAEPTAWGIIGRALRWVKNQLEGTDSNIATLKNATFCFEKVFSIQVKGLRQEELQQVLNDIQDRCHQAATADKLLNLHNQLTTIINHLQTRPPDKEEYEELTQYAQFLDTFIENRQRELLRTEATPQATLAASESEALSGGIQGLVQRVPFSSREQQSAFIDLAQRFTGYHSSGDVSYQANDFNVLAEAKAHWQQALRNNASLTPTQIKELQAALDLADDIEASLKQTLQKQIARLQEQHTQLEQMHRSPSPMDKRMICHDLYWDFHCPLEPHFDLEAFLSCLDRPLPKGIAIPQKSKQALQLLKLHQNTINNKDNAASPEPQNKEEYETFQTHKITYLQNTAQRNRSKSPPKVVVLGGGPGGLMRLLAAKWQGADVSLVEKREEWVRKNRVILDLDSPLLEFFGVYDAFKEKAIEVVPYIALRDIETTLDEQIKRIFGTKAQALKKSSQVIDIRVGKSESQIEAGCFIRESSGKATWLPADVIVDATGGIAAAATILGKQRQAYAEKVVMLAVYEKQIKEGREIETYTLVEVLEEHRQQVLDNLPLEKDLLNKKRKLDQLWDALQKPELSAKQKKVCEEALSKYLRKAGAFNPDKPLQQNHDEYNEHLIKDLEECRGKIKGPFEAAIRAKKIDPDKISEITPFIVEVGSREPATMVHNCLVEESGDAFLSPDPALGKGVNNAIASTMGFARSVDGARRKVAIQKRYHSFAFASKSLEADFLSLAKKVPKRKFEKLEMALYELRQTPLIPDGNSTHFLSEKEQRMMKVIIEKAKQKLPLSPSEINLLRHIRAGWNEIYKAYTEKSKPQWADSFNALVNGHAKYSRLNSK